MPSPPRDPELEAEIAAAAQRIVAALRRAGRAGFRTAFEISGTRLTLGARPSRIGPCADCDDLPEPVRALAPALRRVYRFVRDFRARAAEDELWPADIQKGIARESPRDELSIRTVFRALKKLVALDELAQHPASGYRLGARQPRLPF